MVDEDKRTRWIVGPHREFGSDYASLLGYAVDTESGSEGSRVEDRTPAASEFAAGVALEFVGPSTAVDRLHAAQPEWTEFATRHHDAVAAFFAGAQQAA